MPAIEQLGLVSTRSGVLIVIDTGYLNLWSHDRQPVLPNGILHTEEATKRANSFVDFRIIGPDAERAGRLLDMSWHPLYVYDQPPGHIDLQNKLDEILRKHSLNARFEVLDGRVPHRERVDLAIRSGLGAGEVQFHGIWAVAVSGVPTDQPIPVLAERSTTDYDRWNRVVIPCRPQMKIARSEKVGAVGVDYARLLIADVDSLGRWQHEKSLDGMADYVFWGCDASKVASQLDAPELESGEFGWVNVSEDRAREFGLAVQNYRDEHSLKLAGDYRPHSDHWRVMTPTRKSSTESASAELAGTTVCNFMTTWGDGVFDVHRDLTEMGNLVQIRVELESIPRKQPIQTD